MSVLHNVLSRDGLLPASDISCVELQQEGTTVLWSWTVGWVDTWIRGVKRQRSQRVRLQKAFGKVLIDSIHQQEPSEGFSVTDRTVRWEEV